MSPCPSPEALDRLGHDSLDEAGFLRIEDHVASCPDCQAMLERLARRPDGPRANGPAPPSGPPTIPGFVIEHEIGRGATGVVYRAWQPQLARRVAIKVLCGLSAEERDRWPREARAIGRARHPNVVRLYEAGEHDGRPYLVLEFLPAGSLKGRLTGPLLPRVAAGLVEAVARAVEHIHGVGLLHLDIKPSNILLDGPAGADLPRLTPMLADFGIARAADDPGATASGPLAARGTPSFMAPEQIAGDRSAIGPRADVFALGATLYNLLTGRPPFQAATAIETLDLVRTRDPAPPRSLVPGLPRDLETIAATCLRKDPRRRYASAGALADDLRRWLDGYPIAARPASRVERAVRHARRRPVVASLLAALALTIASSLGGLLALWRDAEAQRVRAQRSLARALEDERVATGAVEHLIELLTTTVDAPQLSAVDRVAESDRVVRELTASLRRAGHAHDSSLFALAGLEYRLSQYFVRKGEYGPARELLADALRSLEARRWHDPDDPQTAAAIPAMLISLGVVSLHQDRLDDALDGLHRAVTVLEGRASPGHPTALVQLYRARCSLADALGRRGLAERRRAVLRANLRTFEDLGARARSDAVIAALAALARMDLGADGGAGAELAAAIGRFGNDRDLPAPLRELVAQRIARDVVAHPLPEAVGADPAAPMPPEARVEAILARIDRWRGELGLPTSLIPAVCLNVSYVAASEAALHRKAGRPEDARRTADWLAAFGRELERRDPRVPEHHLVASAAREQEAKNAWRADDRAAVERAVRGALAKARDALRLAPQDVDVRVHYASLQKKLLDVTCDRIDTPER